MTSTPPADRLEDLLRDTFTAHEHLADGPVQLVPAVHPAVRRPLALGAAAAAAAVVVVAVVATTLHDGSTPVGASQPTSPSSGPTSSGSAATGLPSGVVLQTDAGNKALATTLADDTIAKSVVYDGSREVAASAVPELDDRNAEAIQGPVDYTVARSRYWTTAGDPQTVALWLAAHPQPGFVADAGPGAVGGHSGQTNTWIEDVYFHQPDQPLSAGAGVSVTVQTTLLADGSVGIRTTAQAIWRPARPAASYVTDVRSVTIHTTSSRVSDHGPDQVRLRTITDAATVGRLVDVYNQLPGWPPFVHSCPLHDQYSIQRVVFHTSTGDVSALSPGTCFDNLTVRRGGQLVWPYLDHAGDLTRLLE